MIRFRNPGTQIDTQIAVFKMLYNELKDAPSFGIKEMAVVIARNNLLTAYGYAGDNALKLSNTEQESMNSANMNAKMYAEVFRMLGWVSPIGKKSYPVSFTIIGRHIALSEDYPKALIEECILGINNPTELTDKMSYSEEVRFFKCALRSLNDLGGLMYKHELSLGPMSVNDTDEREYENMIAYIKSIRGNISTLKIEFSKLAKSLGMKEVPVDNCTRIPVAFLSLAGYVKDENTTTLYGKSLKCLRLTDYGKATLSKLNQMKDLRLKEFNLYPRKIKLALIRIGIYQMLQRSGYDIASVETQLKSDISLCSHILNGRELLFSPCQTIKYDIIKEALGEIDNEEHSADSILIYTVTSDIARAKNQLVDCALDTDISGNPFIEKSDRILIQEIKSLSATMTTNDIVDTLFKKAEVHTQAQFYPLVASLFRIIGFDCQHSRAGDNGARWDAIIKDNTNSVPIEIKSPTEEMHLSLKALRQTVENKIILLSRETHKTKREISTLAVGYLLPNDRAEVSSLIKDFKNTYGIKIGIIDYRSLVKMAVSSVLKNRTINKDDICNLEGMINVNL